MARKFLYFIAICVFLVIAALFALRIWSTELTRIAFVPSIPFTQQNPLAANVYDDQAMWFSRPGKSGADPARWQPGYDKELPAPRAVTTPAPPFAVFFVHPTSYPERDHWNAPLNDPRSQQRARVFVRGMASPFNQATEIWAPRYRQATLGAFLTDKPEASRALDAAYLDVALAFDLFLSKVDPKLPIVLAGHSQGSAHIVRLLREKIAGRPLQSRIAAVYAIGWPISFKHDLPLLGLPACSSPTSAGCIVTWSSYAEPAEPKERLDFFAQSTGLDGKRRGNAPVLCVNPLTGSTDGAPAPASANLGTLRPDAKLESGELVPGGVPARCDENGILLVGDPPQMGPFVLPGNDYHVYDIPLFWANLKADVVRRVQAWQKRH